MSNETKWTPGPWVASNSSVIGVDSEVITTCVQGFVQRRDHCEDYATARLIAAAPDLYEALEAIIDNIELSTPNKFVMNALGALKKARGES